MEGVDHDLSLGHGEVAGTDALVDPREFLLGQLAVELLAEIRQLHPGPNGVGRPGPNRPGQPEEALPDVWTHRRPRGGEEDRMRCYRVEGRIDPAGPQRLTDVFSHRPEDRRGVGGCGGDTESPVAVVRGHVGAVRHVTSSY